MPWANAGETHGSGLIGRTGLGVASVAMEGVLPPTILVVDDDPQICRLLTRVLKRAGYNVEQAADGMAALDQIATHAPDLVLSDVQMPRLDGIGLALRLARCAASIPIILMSGERVPPEILAPFIAKPFALQTVLELVERLLGEPGADSGIAALRQERERPATAPAAQTPAMRKAI